MIIWVVRLFGSERCAYTTALRRSARVRNRETSRMRDEERCEER
jgi:hypothetical protein